MQFQSIKSSVLLSEKEGSVTPEPIALHGDKSDIKDMKIVENKERNAVGNKH